MPPTAGHVLRPIQSPDAQSVCALSGLQSKLYSEKLIVLRDLEATLQAAILDAEKSAADHRLGAKLLVGARAVKISCDVVLHIASLFLGPGQALAGQATSMIYDRATLVVDGFNGDLNAKGLTQHLASTKVDLASEMLKSAGKGLSADVLGSIKSLFLVADQVYAAVKEYNKAVEDGSGIDGAKRTALTQLRRVRAKMAPLEAALRDCGLQ